MSETSAAVARFMNDDIFPKLKQAHIPPTMFRLTQLYTADVDTLIQRRLPSLKAIFDVLVARGKSTTRRHKLLGVVDWLAFLKAANITGPDASERDATLCFVWSRMCVVDERTELGHLREENLPFEGFLEAIVRLSLIKAFPTDEEIDEWRRSDISGKREGNAAAYLANLKQSDEVKLRELVETRGCAWGSGQEQSQPTERCVEHMCSLLAHVIVGHGDEEVSAVMMGRWVDHALTKQETS